MTTPRCGRARPAWAAPVLPPGLSSPGTGRRARRSCSRRDQGVVAGQRRWIDTYAGAELGAVVSEVLALTDRIGVDLGAGERERMRHHFLTSARYEWMFWEMGYRQERWPI